MAPEQFDTCQCSNKAEEAPPSDLLTTSSSDELSFEIIRNSLQALVEEAGVALAKSAYSTNIKTRQDFSCAIFDKDVRCIAQAFTQPSHLVSLIFSVPMAIREYGVENLSPGDGILINDSHRGMVHLNDIALISPLTYDDKTFGYAVDIAHHIDVGGKAPGSIAVATEIYQEGIIIPGVKLVKRGEIDQDILKLLIANVRGKKQSPGDYRAQVAANKLADRRMRELLERYGPEVVQSTITRLYEYTENRVKHAIKDFPKGDYYGEGYVDDDGITDTPIRLAAKVTIHDGGFTVDMSDSDAQNDSFTNSTYGQTYANVVYALKCLLPTDIPVNDGFYRTIKVIAPSGKVVNCEFPHAVGAGWEVSLKATEVVFSALSKAMPEKIAAEGKKTIFQVAFGGVDPRDGDRYAFYETMAGGYGARPTKDGEDAVQAHTQNTQNSPVEELEVGYPVMILGYSLIPDSEGAGRFRGGLGLRRTYRFVDHKAIVTILADTAKFAPRGLDGGLEGRTSHFIYYPGDSKAPVPVRSKTTFEAGPNRILVVETPGGGGFGTPSQRDPEAVLRDVRDGKISLERASSIYRVAIDSEELGG